MEASPIFAACSYQHFSSTSNKNYLDKGFHKENCCACKKQHMFLCTITFFYQQKTQKIPVIKNRYYNTILKLNSVPLEKFESEINEILLYNIELTAFSN